MSDLQQQGEGDLHLQQGRQLLGGWCHLQHHLDLCAAKGILASYEGESSRNSFTRGSQHLRDLETRRTGSPLGDHANKYHPGTAMGKDSVTMECTGTYPRPTQRLASEGLAIERLIRQQKAQGSEKVIIINSKTNFHQPSLISNQSAKLRLE